VDFVNNYFGCDIVRAEKAAVAQLRRAVEMDDMELVLDWACLVMRIRAQIGTSLLQKVEVGDASGVNRLLEIAAGGAFHDN
jgi:hypothetical protein